MRAGLQPVPTAYYHPTGPIGDIVFTLVDLQLLISQPTDSRDDFADIFDFETAFERDYPWHGAFRT